MSSSFDLDHPERFTAGAVGPPGQRVFYLQAVQDGHVVSLKLEKQQVAALCEYLAGILADLPAVSGALPDQLDLVEPVLPEWAVGSLAVAYEEPTDRIVLVAEELVPDDDDDVLDDDDISDEEVAEALAELLDSGDLSAALGGDEGGSPTFAAGRPATARFRLTRSQVLALVRHAADVVSAGRPPCRLCGQPIDPDGHLCPRNN